MRYSKSMIEAVKQVGLYEALDYAIVDGDNKIIGLYKGNMAKKHVQMNMKGAERQVGIKKPLKIMPVSNKKKGDTVIGIGELTDKERGEIEEDVKNALAGFDNRVRDAASMDRKDLIKAKELYKRKDVKRLRQHIYSLDTSPLETVMNLISIQDRPFFDKMYPNTRGGEFLARIAYQHRHLDENIDENKDDEKKRMKGAKLRLKMGDETIKEENIRVLVKDVKDRNFIKDLNNKAKQLKVDVSEKGGRYIFSGEKMKVNDVFNFAFDKSIKRGNYEPATMMHEEGGPEHEITVGNYTTKFFYMCGSAQTTMKKHADKEGAEELTRMQDVFYKMEKDAMDAGGSSDEQKKKSQILYDKIIAKADDMGIKNEVDKYMKLHLTSMLNNKPKLGFGRTDLDESLWANIHKKRQRIKQGSGERMRKKGEKGAPTPAQMKRAQDASEKKLHNFKEFQLRNAWGEITEKSEYQGRPVELNNPTRGDRKKYKVYVKNDKGNVVKVEYGDPNMSIKRDDPERRKSFRARHNCDNPGPKYKARYWSCKFWSTKSVTDLMKG